MTFSAFLHQPRSNLRGLLDWPAGLLDLNPEKSEEIKVRASYSPPSSYSFPLAISVLIPRVLFSCLYLSIAEEKLGKESNV